MSQCALYNYFFLVYSTTIEILQKHEHKLKKPGVAGYGIGVTQDGKEIIRVHLERADVALPSELDGVPVTPILTGYFEVIS